MIIDRTHLSSNPANEVKAGYNVGIGLIAVADAIRYMTDQFREVGKRAIIAYKEKEI